MDKTTLFLPGLHLDEWNHWKTWSIAEYHNAGTKKYQTELYNCTEFMSTPRIAIFGIPDLAFLRFRCPTSTIITPNPNTLTLTSPQPKYLNPNLNTLTRIP